jgi:hypothetical protein
MSEDNRSGEARHAKRRGGREQMPVDSDYISKYWFDAGTVGDLVRIVAMNHQSTTSCSSYTEYHYSGTSLSVGSVSGLTLYGGALNSNTQTAIDDFVGTMSQRLSMAQSPSWCRGVYSPSGAQARLYKATDPDDSTKMIGVLIEQDTSNRLVQITWYKTTNTGPIFASAPGSLSFSLVTDTNGNPSTDPNDIGGWTWYYTSGMGSAQ